MSIIDKIKGIFKGKGDREIVVDPKYLEARDEAVSIYQSLDGKKYYLSKKTSTRKNDNGTSVVTSRVVLLKNGTLIICDDMKRSDNDVTIDGYPKYSILSKDKKGKYVFKTTQYEEVPNIDMRCTDSAIRINTGVSNHFHYLNKSIEKLPIDEDLEFCLDHIKDFNDTMQHCDENGKFKDVEMQVLYGQTKDLERV